MFNLYSLSKEEPNESAATSFGLVSWISAINVVKTEDGYEAQLELHDNYGGGGTLTRAIPPEIFNQDFDTFVEELCQKVSVKWFKPDPERVKRLDGIREFFGF